MQRWTDVVLGWCKACGGVKTLDAAWGRCGDCGSPHVSSQRPAEPLPLSLACPMGEAA